MAVRPLIFGEVLFDLFPDGAAVLGGAPFNVAWHLQGLGLDPLFVSRVGDDDNGRRVLRHMREWGMDTRGVQIDPEHPTGTVKITLEQGQPRFDIVDGQAYDYIDPTSVAEILSQQPFDVLYCGTLATRHRVSWQALQVLFKKKIPRFVDINLRPPWWNEDGVERVLRGARWAKLNDEELGEISPHVTGGGIEPRAAALRRAFNLDLLILTMGAKGAYFVTSSDTFAGAPVPVQNPVDTVGAGDAFSAVVLLGLMNGWPLALTQQRALSFASALCGIRGATTFDNDFYTAHLETWRKQETAD